MFTGEGIFSPKDYELHQFITSIAKVSSQRIGMIARGLSPFATDGDSGGPVFHDGKIIAVMSTVSEYCETEFGEDYGILNTATLLSGFRFKLLN